MRQLKQSTARDILVFMADSTDHVTGKTGLTLTITASKNAAAFASITPTVTERGSGWYKLALTTAHSDTLGDLALHITGSGADPADVLMEVVVDLPGVAQTGDSYPLIPTTAQIAAALLDLANGIETGLTPRQALRLIAAVAGGKVAGGGTATNTFRNAVADSKARVTATVDSDGNRTAITTDLT